MSTHRMTISLIAILFSFAVLTGWIVPADIFAADDKAISATSDINAPSNQTTADKSRVEKFRRDILSRIRSLRKNIVAARETTVRRQKRQRRQATRPDDMAFRDARTRAGTAREVLAEMEWDGIVEARYWPLAGGSAAFGRDRYDYIGYPDPEGGVILTLESVERALAQAVRDLQEAAEPEVPMELLLFHNRELQAYDAVEEEAQKAQKLCLKAVRMIRALADQPDLQKTEMERWERIVNESIRDVYSALTKARGGRWVAQIKPVEPIGFFTVSASALASVRRDVRTGSKQGKQALVILARVRSEWFTPPMGRYYRKLRRKYGGLFSSSGRRRALVFDASRFRLVRDDGRRLAAQEFMNPHRWGGDVVTGRYRLIFDSGMGLRFDGLIDPSTWGSDVVFCTAARCILWHRRNPPPTVTIQVIWFLDVKDDATGFKLQLDNFKPVSVPDVQVESAGG